MTWPPLTRQDHATFCVTEGWTLVRNARGRGTTHHETYELCLSDGRVAHHVLRDQLHVTQEDFWACVRDGVRPERGLVRAPAESLPVELAYLLVHRVGLPDAEVAGLTKDQAVKILNDYWAAGSGD